MELGVGVAFFADDHQLRTESEEGQGAVEGRELVGLREILAFRGPAGEIGPVGLEEAAGHGGRGSHAETQRQRVGSREAARVASGDESAGGAFLRHSRRSD